MANITLTNLPVVTSLTGSEPLLGVQSSTSVQITVGQIATYANAQSNITQIGTGRVLANISGSTAYPTGVTVSDLLDNTITNVAGSVMYRSLSTWTALPPGILGQALTTNGPSASPQWRDFSGGGTVLQINEGTNISITPVNPITSSGTINTVMNPAFTTSVTTPLIIGGTTASSTLTLQSTSGVGTSDAISFKVGNNGATTAMTINTSGQVGIGTTSPSTQLYVQSPSTNGLVINQVLRNPNGGSPVAAIGFNVALTGEGDYTQAGIGLLRSVANGSGSLCFYNKGSGTASNFTTADEKMRIDASGNVGIGTSSPATKLDVSGNIRLSAGNPLIQFNNGGPQIYVTAANTLQFSINSGLSEAMRIDSSGNVGIGTSSPSAKLDVRGSSTFLVNATNPTAWVSVDSALTTGSMYNQWNTTSNVGISGTYTNHAYTFVTNNAERMRIDTSGNVGIGTSSPGSLLHIQSSAPSLRLQETSANNVRGLFSSASTGVYVTTDYSSTGIPIIFGMGGVGAAATERMRIDANGNVIIGTTAITWDERLSVRPSGTGAVGIASYSNSTSYTGSLFRAQAENETSANFKLYEGRGPGGAINYWVDGAGGAYFASNVAIGTSGPLANVDLLTNANITGGTTAYAHYNNGVVQSGVTTLASAYVSNISLTTAAFTTGSVPHFWANPGAGGAGSIITNQYGFFADSTVGTQGAATVTNAYGFYGNIASATNRWNLYMGGTAPNYMAGNLGIGSAALTQINLRVSSNITGATNAYAVYADGVIQSGATSSAAAYTSTIASAAAAFTTTSVSHFFASPNVGGAGSTITNHIGFNVAGELGTQGAATVTNAYGFYGGIASATNRYNIYMAGTANNYFAGYSFGLGGVMARTSSTATNTVTLTATQVASGFIVGTPTATASYTLPTAAALDTELSNSPTGTNFELVVFTTAAFAITILTNTGWTLVGSMATGATANSFARFRANKTGAGAWSLYRIS